MEKWLTPPLLLSLAALIISAANSYYTRKRDAKGDWQKLVDGLQKQIDDLRQDCNESTDKRTENEASLRVLSKQMELFWRTVEQQMARKFKDE